MKYSYLASTLAFAVITTAGHAKPNDAVQHDSKAISQTSAHAKMHRVSQENLESQFTAQDLIGKSLYDSTGEKIGTVTDISLPALASQKKMHKDSADLSSESWKQGSSTTSNEPTIFISVGGLLGIGDDIVAAPASSIWFNSSEDRYTLSVSKQEVVALAEQDSIDLNVSEKTSSERRYSAKQAFDSDIVAVRNALNEVQEDKEMGLSRIMVKSDGDKLVLTGTLPTESAKRRAEVIARKHTDMPIENSISVKEMKNK